MRLTYFSGLKGCLIDAAWISTLDIKIYWKKTHFQAKKKGQRHWKMHYFFSTSRVVVPPLLLPNFVEKKSVESPRKILLRKYDFKQLKIISVFIDFCTISFAFPSRSSPKCFNMYTLWTIYLLSNHLFLLENLHLTSYDNNLCVFMDKTGWKHGIF